MLDPVLLIHRLAFRVHRWRVPLVPTVLYLMNRILFGIVLPPSVVVGRGVKFAYLGLGTVIHRSTVLGDGVVVGPNVTIGGRSGHARVPVIAAGAYLGAGARVLGPVTVGENAVVGANAVVLEDVPANCVVVGIPARVVKTGIPPGAFR